MYKFILALLLFSIVSSCKKKDDEVCVFTSITYPKGSVETYDIQNGKITNIKSAGYTTTYAYNSSKQLVSIKQYYNGQLKSTSIFSNRPDGQMSQVTRSSSYGPPISTSLFVYRDDVLNKEIIRRTEDTIYRYYTFEGKDLVEISEYRSINNQEVLNSTTYYIYGTDLNPLYDLYPSQSPETYSKYLLVQKRIVSIGTDVYDYTYTFDSKGLLTSSSRLYGNQAPYTISYQYTCQ